MAASFVEALAIRSLMRQGALKETLSDKLARRGCFPTAWPVYVDAQDGFK
jgi:hypothetical protein